MQGENIERLTELPNGMRVATCYMPGSMSVSAMWRMGGGASADFLHTGAGLANGLAHVVEHCAATGQDGKLGKPIENRGGDSNAKTSRDEITMEMHILAGSGNSMFRYMLENGLRNPAITPDVVRREVKRVKQELREYAEVPDMRAYENGYATLFKGQPRGCSVGGTVRGVGKITAETLSDYFNRYRQGNNLTIAAAGAVDHDAIVRLTEIVLGDLPRGEAPHIPPSMWASGEGRKIDRGCGSVHLGLYLPGKAAGHPDGPALTLANILLGQRSDSVLFEEISNKKGYVYGVMSETDRWANDGLVEIATSTEPRFAQPLLRSMADTIYTKFPRMLTPDLLKQARNIAVFSVVGERETPAVWTNRALLNIAHHGRVLPLSEITAAFGAVTLDQLQRVTQEMTGQLPFVYALGPVQKVQLLEPFAEALARRPARLEI